MPEPKMYAPTSNFASCPAATGVALPAEYGGTKGCPQFPDSAHRCREARGTHTVHVCTCRYAWISSSAPHGE